MPDISAPPKRKSATWLRNVVIANPATGDTYELDVYLHPDGYAFGIDGNFLVNDPDCFSVDETDADADPIVLDPFVNARDLPIEHTIHLDQTHHLV